MIHFHDVSSVIKMVFHDMYSRHFHYLSRRCFTIQHVTSRHNTTIPFSRYVFTMYLVLPRWLSTTRTHDTFSTGHDGVSRYNTLHQNTISRYIVHATFSWRVWFYQYGFSRHVFTTLTFPVTVVFHDTIRYNNTLYHDMLSMTHFHDTYGAFNMVFHDTYSRHFHSRSWRCFAIQLVTSRHNTTILFSRYIFTIHLEFVKTVFHAIVFKTLLVIFMTLFHDAFHNITIRFSRYIITIHLECVKTVFHAIFFNALLVIFMTLFHDAFHYATTLYHDTFINTHFHDVFGSFKTSSHVTFFKTQFHDAFESFTTLLHASFSRCTFTTLEVPKASW